ncbi:MAG: PKD domain-containing protein [Saccharospirillaceae bacterium]|nr:PKD domain-containing protein [Pseudomonadales bacterium]NRB80252.1 PKD domain-containing protein [Saccharospirillaceae bacterium]
MYIKPISALLTSLLIVGCSNNAAENEAPNSDFIQSGNMLIVDSSDKENSRLSYQWLVDGVLASEEDNFNTSNLTGDVVITLVTIDSEGLKDEKVMNMSFGGAGNQAPVSSFSQNGNSLIATSTDKENNNLSYQWLVDGVEVSEGSTFNTSHLTGNVEITLITTDSAFVSHNKIMNINFGNGNGDTNYAPIAEATASVYSGTAPINIIFDGSGSTDDNSISSYSWSVGGQTKEGKAISHTFDTPGTYSAILTVTDEQGEFDNATVMVVINSLNSMDDAPVAVIDANVSQGASPFTVIFSASDSSDDNSISSYSWDFGDGNTAVGESVYNVFMTDGDYTVYLTVTDSANQSDIATTVISVNSGTVDNQSPMANFTISKSELVVTVDAGTSTDPEQLDLSYAWEFLDTNNMVVGIDTGETTSYVFASEGLKSIRLTVTDAGGLDHSIVHDVTVAAAAVVINDESYSLDKSTANFDVYNILKCGDNPTVNNDNYVILSDSKFPSGTGWNHISTYFNEFSPVISQAGNDYNIATNFNGSASDCNDTNTHDSILVKKFADWDHQHANGINYSTSGNPSFADFESVVIDLFIDSSQTVLPTMSEIKSTYSSYINDSQATSMDDGEFHLQLILKSSNDYSGSIDIALTRDDLDKWLRISVPKEKMDLWQEVSYNRVSKTISQMNSRSISSIQLVAETQSRQVVRNFTDGSPGWDTNTPKLFKEEAIRIKYIGLTTSGNDFDDEIVDAQSTDPDTDTDTQTDVSTSDCSDMTLDFCADFEDGSLPNDLIAAQSYQFDNIGYKSNKSVKVTPGMQNFFKVIPPSDDFWTRVFIRSNGDSGTGKFNNIPNQQSSRWGGDTQGFARAHGVLLKGLDGSSQMRVGDHRCQLEINRDGGNGHLGDDLEMTSGNYGDSDTVCDQTFGARMQTNKWYCMEVHFNGPESEVQVFWDNQNVEQLHVTADRTWTNEDKPPGGMWSPNAGELWGPYNYDYFAFGYESFNNGGDTPNNTFWYDNVAVSTTRVGCGDDYVENGTLDDSTKLQPTSNGYPYSNDGGTDNGGGDNGGGDIPGDLGNGTIIVYENFESTADNTIPAGYTYRLPNNVNESTKTVGVVSNKSAYGSKSLMATVNENVGDMMMMKELPAGLDQVYVRMFFNTQYDIGAPSSGKNHSHFTTLQTAQTNPYDAYSVEQIRVGDAKGTFGLNVKGGDGLYPASNSDWNGHASNYIKADTWTCIELAYINTGVKSQFEAWVDGESFISIDGNEFHSAPPGGDKWLDDMFEQVGFGWYDWGFNELNTVWFDEIVISTERIGCNPPS